MQTWYEVVLLVVNVVMSCFVLPALYHVRKVRTNELVHIEAQLKSIEGKLDKHIEWHLNHKG